MEKELSPWDEMLSDTSKHFHHVERIGAVVAPWTLGRVVAGSSLVKGAVGGGLEQVTFPKRSL